MKMNRKVVRSVICVLLALIFIVSLMTALIPINASAASQSEINQLTQQRKELQAKQKEQQKTINNLRSKKASVVDQKAALDQENDLAQQEIEVVKQQITAYDQQIEDKGVELEEAKQEEEAQTVRFRGCVRHLEEYGQMSYIAILLEATSLSDLLARMDMVGEVIAYNKQVQADMTAAREKVETVNDRLWRKFVRENEVKSVAAAPESEPFETGSNISVIAEYPAKLRDLFAAAFASEAL